MTSPLPLAPFTERTTTAAHEVGFQQVFRYQLLSPESPRPGQTYPLVVFLHGAGERGNDGLAHLSWLPRRMAEPRLRELYSCYVLAVQCRSAQQWVDVAWDDAGSTPIRSDASAEMVRVIAAIEELFAFAAVDRRRVYLTGLSMGGYGVWDLAMRRPEWFAALVPICGGGDEGGLERLRDLPTWVWHGVDDDVVPVSRSRAMVTALQTAGSDVRYTELAGRGHDVWLEAYEENGALEWMFEQCKPEHSGVDLVPLPSSLVASNSGDLVLSGKICSPAELSAVAEVLASELCAVTGIDFGCSEGSAVMGDIVLRHDSALGMGYVVRVGDQCTISAGGHRSLSAATSKLVQLVQVQGELAALPGLTIKDQPETDYCCQSVDCARYPHSLDTLKQAVDLCRFYSVGLLQLHLTDDSAFTFPVDALPGLATKGRCYTKRELRELDRYAQARGVGLVPEFDVPGHCAALVAHDPERYGLADYRGNPALAHLTRPEVLTAIATVVREMCAVFQSSPYFHFGADEARLEGVDRDPDCQAYALQHGHDSAEDLFRVFCNEVYGIVKAAGRTAIVWEGFRREGSEVPLPKDLCVVAWDARFYRPDHLVADGYPVINASWRPLYVVGGGRLPLHSAPRRWSSREIYAWEPNWFDHYDAASLSYGGLSVLPEKKLEAGRESPRSKERSGVAVFGAQMCAWEQTAASLIDSLLTRVAAFAEKTWHPHLGSFRDFESREALTRSRCLAIVRPVTILPRPAGSAVVVPLTNDDRVRIATSGRGVVRYTVDGSEPGASSVVYHGPLSPDQLFAGPGRSDKVKVTLRARLFAEPGQLSAGRPLGGCDQVSFVRSVSLPLDYQLYHASAPGSPCFEGLSRRQAYDRGRLEAVRGGPFAGPLIMVMQGRIRIGEAGEQCFALRSVDGALRLWVAGKLVCDRPVAAASSYTEGRIVLSAGVHDVRIEFAQGPLSSLCRVRYRSRSRDRWRLIDRLLID